MTQPVKIWFEGEGRLLRLRLRPKANLIDATMIAALDAALSEQSGVAISAVLLDAEGPHFSFGASVEEHLPSTARPCSNRCIAVAAMIEFPAPILVAVRGQCLGGGLEVALAGHLIFAAPDASSGSRK